MLLQRTIIKAVLEKYFIRENYILSKNSRYSYALDAFVIAYTPSGGGSDNIKVEINYAMRSHLLPLEHKKLDLGIVEIPFEVLTVSKIEIYAGKINALLSRNQIRDLYDTYQMIKNNLMNQAEIEILKNTLLFYRFIQNDAITDNHQLEKKFTMKNYTRDLLPVIKKGDAFNLQTAIQFVSHFIKQITEYDEYQLEFINSTETGLPAYNLLFSDEEMIKNANNHPLTQWKLIHSNKNK